MSDEVVVVATFKVKPGQEDAVEQALAQVIEGSHTEEGCIKYALHRGSDDPSSYAMVERWRSRADLDAHGQQPHMAAIVGALEHLAEPPQILFTQSVPYGDAEKGTLA